MKQVVFWFIILIIVLVGAWYIQKYGIPSSITTINKQKDIQSNTSRLSIADKVTVSIEIADTNEKRTLGLSYRENLPENSGMLFIFDNPGIYSFWMKGMNFPLDMIWIGEDNRIVDITENLPNPYTDIALVDLPHYSPQIPVKMVLEVNAGFVQSKKIVVGDGITINK